MSRNITREVKFGAEGGGGKDFFCIRAGLPAESAVSEALSLIAAIQQVTERALADGAGADGREISPSALHLVEFAARSAAALLESVRFA
jgi:hypothetical protein